MISIALATYNGEKFLKKQLDSLVLQTYNDFEIIAVDDASTDNTLNILNEFAKKHKEINIKIFKNNNRLGFSKNFERAISFVKANI